MHLLATRGLVICLRLGRRPGLNTVNHFFQCTEVFGVSGEDQESAGPACANLEDPQRFMGAAGRPELEDVRTWADWLVLNVE